jgi:hypothetical protein
MSQPLMQPISASVKRTRRAAIAVMVSLQAFTPIGASAAPGPFDGFAGSWSGSGTLKFASGESERLRCRVTYAVGDNGLRLQQELRCASDSYSFNVTSAFSYNADAGRLSGTWAETNYNNNGFLSGTVNGGSIQAKVEGRNFTASIAMTTRGNEQSVTIQPDDSDISEVSVALRRAG